LYGARVSVNVDKTHLLSGDDVVYSISATGNNIIFPHLSKIGNYDIEAISQFSNLSIKNGKYITTITKTYTFTPTKSLTIPSYKVIVDNTPYYTKPIKITVLKNNHHQKFRLDVLAPKRAIVGYPSIITIRFYQRVDTKIDTVSMEISRGDYILKPLTNEEDFYKDNYKIAQIKYLLLPKKAGQLHLKVKLKLGFSRVQQTGGFILPQMQYKFLTKQITIKSDKVFDGLVGDFNISMHTNTTHTTPNEPINATLQIQGYGYLNDIDIPFAPNAIVYANKAEVNTTIKHNRVYSIYKKHYVLVSDHNFTIPSIVLKFYSIKHHQIKSVSTKALHITISTPSHPQVITKTITQTITKTNYTYIVVAFGIGLLIGIISARIKFPSKFSFEDVFDKLIIYADDKRVKRILDKLYLKEKLTKEDKKFIKSYLKGKNGKNKTNI